MTKVELERAGQHVATAGGLADLRLFKPVQDRALPLIHNVEWLMGWPIGWTELKPLAMDKFREWQQQHSPSYRSTATDAA